MKANMHTFQTIVETYAANHNGLYPQSIAHLERVATSQHYWKNIINPLKGEGNHYGKAFVDASEKELALAIKGDRWVANSIKIELFGIRFTNGYSSKTWKGKTIYQRLQPNGYALYGGGRKGYSRFLQDRGRPLVLTNSH